jgi:hypothetical protein
MAKCDYCGSTILFGGVRSGERRFCNDKCRNGGALIQLSSQIPDHVVEEAVWKVHQGNCPQCSGSGPVDVHKSYRVWSALIITRWSSRLQVSCRSCGVKAQLWNATISLVAGWWGFPWGLVLTPVQVVRNIISLASPPDRLVPSQLLRQHVRLMLASSLAQQSRAGSEA